MSEFKRKAITGAVLLSYGLASPLSIMTAAAEQDHNVIESSVVGSVEGIEESLMASPKLLTKAYDLSEFFDDEEAKNSFIDSFNESNLTADADAGILVGVPTEVYGNAEITSAMSNNGAVVVGYAGLEIGKTYVITTKWIAKGADGAERVVHTDETRFLVEDAQGSIAISAADVKLEKGERLFISHSLEKQVIGFAEEDALAQLIEDLKQQLDEEGFVMVDGDMISTDDELGDLIGGLEGELEGEPGKEDNGLDGIIGDLEQELENGGSEKVEGDEVVKDDSLTDLENGLRDEVEKDFDDIVELPGTDDVPLTPLEPSTPVEGDKPVEDDKPVEGDKEDDTPAKEDENSYFHKYNKLDLDMNYDQIVEIMGKEGLQDDHFDGGSLVVSSYAWIDGEDAVYVGIYEEKLVAKSYVGPSGDNKVTADNFVEGTPSDETPTDTDETPTDTDEAPIDDVKPVEDDIDLIDNDTMGDGAGKEKPASDYKQTGVSATTGGFFAALSGLGYGVLRKKKK